jgi:polar amino acid transport system substrate-binding protein
VALLAAKDDRVDAVAPFDDVVIDGAVVAGYGAFGFRQGDEAFRGAFDQALKNYIGTAQWEKTVAPFGFGQHTRPDKTRAELCAGSPEKA